MPVTTRVSLYAAMIGWCAFPLHSTSNETAFAQDLSTSASPTTESTDVPAGVLKEGQQVKTVEDDLNPGDVIKICSQWVRWESDDNANGAMDRGEVTRYSYKSEQFEPLGDQEYGWIVDWAYRDVDHRDAATVYKKVGDRELRMLITYPEGWHQTDRKPVALFFFGGGFNQGNYFGGKHRAKYYNGLGIVYALVDYRVHSRDGKDTDGRLEKFTRAFEDCKDAVLWIRKNASEYGVDPQKLICCGSSAGTMVKELHWLNEPELRPNALVLQVPYRGLRSLDDIRENKDKMTETMPPTICFAAGKDRISHPFAKNYAEAIVEGGGIAETIVYPDESHVLSSDVYSDMHEQSRLFLERVGIVEDRAPQSVD